MAKEEFKKKINLKSPLPNLFFHQFDYISRSNIFSNNQKNPKMRKLVLLLVLACLVASPMYAQKKKKKKKKSKETTTVEKKKSLLSASTFSGMKFRNVGPAFTSGRIADIAVHPDNQNVWYVAVGSGGVWKTVNAGTTWTPIFDSQKSYSIGCITIDPNNPATIWVGTGENVGGRHVGFGDGIYKSSDGGKQWTSMGLETSEHISEIIVHPENSSVIWVAVQGPLWSKGGERGFYKSTDGGNTWKETLGVDEWTGVTDIAIDPRNPDRLYAASWQRHRTVAALMGGGPGSGIHRSDDGGETWTKLSSGLPRSNMGKIGIALSPQQPDIVYAAIELDRRKGGLYKSTNRGASWKKQSNAISGGTGPHYYQELYASPHQFDKIYLMDVRIQVSDNGGKSFQRLSERGKHSDNHAIIFRENDPNYLLIGSDGGLYESFDNAENWRFINNMAITQYYKVAVDDALPFYNIYGGTQDNGSHGGPSETDNRHGIRNADWYKTLGGDGHQSATEHGNPDIIYAQSQQGVLHRVDVTTGEQVYIQPQADEGADYERYNWDAPIIVSTHKPSTIYFGSQRVWKSENRGDSWTAISGDLSRQDERIKLPIMGKLQSWDNPWDIYAMSNFSSITSLSESPIDANIIYAGTDDGLIQITEDGGKNWRRVEVGSISGVPARAFVNDIKADLYDANTVYVTMDNHKEGDFKPYLFKSTDKGATWRSIASNLPDRHLVWRVVQDHVKANLLFAATEFGIFFTVDGGNKWVKFKGGLPTISFRDLTIQKRQNDLVAASFGRSFFVLDDYSALRDITEDNLKEEAKLFATADAWWYIPRNIISSQGAMYSAPNPDFGATFTYYLKDGFTSIKAERKKKEKKLAKEGKDIPFPGWDALEEENNEEPSKIWLTVKDDQGNIVKKIEAKAGTGIHRVAWDLRYSSKRPIRLRSSGATNPWQRRFNRGALVSPGNYTVSLAKQEDGKFTQLSEPQTFKVVPLKEGSLPRKPDQVYAAHVKAVNDLSTDISIMNHELSTSQRKLNAMFTALERTDIEPGVLDEKLLAVKKQLKSLDLLMNGSDAKGEVGEKNAPTVQSRLSTARRGLMNTYGPTEMHQQSLAVAKRELKTLTQKVMEISQNQMPALERALQEAGAPWIEGQTLPEQPR